jgi:predicted dehydrogenase
MNTLRWGILGTARIARKNWKAIRHSGSGVVVAVASRDLARAGEFIADCQRIEPFDVAPRAMDSDEKVLASPDVDAVYLPLPTALRKEWVLRAAAAGKHIFCEKPCAVSVTDLEEMLAACRRHHVQFMDGVMFMHHRRLDQIRAVLDDGVSLGAMRRIDSHFTFLGGNDFFAQNIRVHRDLEPLGCLGDLGWYSVRLSLWVLRWQQARQATGRILAEKDGVPTAFSGELLFEGGVSANFYCSFLEQHQQWANLSGVKGYLRVPDFVLPLQGNDVAFDLHNIASRMEGCDYIDELSVRNAKFTEPANDPRTAQETNMVRNFAAQVRSGQLDESWPAMALQTQAVVNACFTSARDGGRPVAV